MEFMNTLKYIIGGVVYTLLQPVPQLTIQLQKAKDILFP